ncbi:hypothetical protein ASL14_14990 [Paenibacillus sp. IHB B 3084]|nr:hypothetical protein ASL14_14990 [Paenibacillus sp. IHB B 3084]
MYKKTPSSTGGSGKLIAMFTRDNKGWTRAVWHADSNPPKPISVWLTDRQILETRLFIDYFVKKRNDMFVSIFFVTHQEI